MTAILHSIRLRREVLRNTAEHLAPIERACVAVRQFLYALRREVLRNISIDKFMEFLNTFLYALRREVLRNYHVRAVAPIRADVSIRPSA